ncbi:hypothetical protein [Streptomyces californicus]
MRLRASRSATISVLVAASNPVTRGAGGSATSAVFGGATGAAAFGARSG